MWVVLVYKPGVVRPVAVGPFREEDRADDWAERIGGGYAELDAMVEWTHAPAYRDALKESLADLEAEEPKVFSLG